MSSVMESPVETIAEEKPYRLSVEQFYRMVDLDIFPEDARVGLWEGQIYEKMTKTQAHAVASIDTRMTLMRLLPPGWCFSGENPITVGDDSAPLPDLIVLRGRGKDYITRRPGAIDIGLVVEFSLTSLRIDTGSKLAAYANRGIAAYWVLDLKNNLVYVYESPIPEESRYATVMKFAPGDSIPFTLDGVQVAMIAASDILPIP